MEKQVRKAGLPFLVTYRVRRAILKAYRLMKEYLHGGAVENEECFCNMWYKVQKLKRVIPCGLNDEIDEFIDETLAPIVYDRDTVFADCMTDDIGYYEENGCFRLHDREAVEKFCMNFYKTLSEIDRKLDEFAMKFMRPYLI